MFQTAASCRKKRKEIPKFQPVGITRFTRHYPKPVKSAISNEKKKKKEKKK
jgi:hypothetical protein